MKRSSLAIAIALSSIASVRQWSVAEISPALRMDASYPVGGGKTGIAAARRAAKKRRRSRK
ncbi:hypothetical protein ACSP9K_005062 [Citrobacter werkmanii]|uniref:hypothetical protein n=1 Tax=Citrobacter freundii TaxID=546 RepID=UPI001891BE0F|nr:hypothetical protein [Citrobacter freundii]HAT3668058.1 hypothetical protein [Citrobacter freundii]HEM7943762.1 hypothetical protein [Citrobacter freundii]